MPQDVNVETVEPIDVVEGARDIEWDEAEQCFWWTCHLRQVIHVEMVAGGGGGGGSAKGGNGGSGGAAGEHKFVRVELDPGKYRVDVGIGGRGGFVFQKGQQDDPAKPGMDSSLRHQSGLTFVHCKGGAAGRNGSGPDATYRVGVGTEGGDVVSQWGVVIANGGNAGTHGRPGGPGEFPGAGGGGAGTWGGSNFYSGNGGNGRVRIIPISGI